MKSTPAQILTCNTRCSYWIVNLTNGTTLGFTSHDQDQVIDTITFQASSGFSRTATRQGSGTGGDSHDIGGLFNSAAITLADLTAGRYDGARMYHFEADWTDTAAGKHKLDAGIIGPVTRTRTGFMATVETLDSLLRQTIGRKYRKLCDHTLGDANCGIELQPVDWTDTATVDLLDAVAPTTYDGRRYVCTTAGTTGATEPTWNTTITGTTPDGSAVWTCYEAYTKEGTVTGVTNAQKFQDTARTESADAFNYGWVTWVTGSNAGLSMAVKDYAANGTFTLLMPMPFAISVTDTFTAVRGCNKVLKMPGDEWLSPYTGDCRAKFNTEDGGNAVNFGGFPELAGNDALFDGPDR